MKYRMYIYLLFLHLVFAQKKEFVVYNAKTKTTSSVFFGVDSVATAFAHTSWNYGTLPGISELPSLPPTTIFPNTGFTDYIPASNYFPVINYPIRTAVKLFSVNNDTLKQLCSGTMIGPNLVLTDAHCIYRYDSANDSSFFDDSIVVIPAFDKGNPQTEVSHSTVVKYFVPKSFINSWEEDIAILQLQESIGNKTGWLGFGFAHDTAFFRNKIFHKLSYPMIDANVGYPRSFNGDTLYYTYGVLDLIDNVWLGYNVNIPGIPGQSGSSLFYFDGNDYQIVGTMVYSYNSFHMRIKGEMFYSLKEICDKVTSVSSLVTIIPQNYEVFPAYPNPFNGSTIISFILPKPDVVSIKVFDAIGREVLNLTNSEFAAGKHSIIFNANDLTSGIYFYRFISGGFQKINKIILLK